MNEGGAVRRFILFLILWLIMGAGRFSVPARAGHGADLDRNAVIYGGVHDKADLAGKIKSGDNNPYGRTNDLAGIFAARGISEDEINDSVEGEVNKNGQVMVGGRVVANSAMSYGREYMDGSKRDGDLWKRKTEVSFQSQTLPALVYLNGSGQFEWAVIKSCGNPVVAEAVRVVKVQTPPPPPALPPPTPTPPPVAPSSPPPSTPRTGGDLGGILASGALSYGIFRYKSSREKILAALKDAAVDSA
jgi:hypothetical protein